MTVLLRGENMITI